MMQSMLLIMGFVRNARKLMEWIPTPKAKMESDVTPARVLDYTEVQSYLRLDGTDDQPLVLGLIDAVTSRVEEFIGRKLISQVWSIYYDFFPKADKQDAWWDGVRDGAPQDLYAQINHLNLPFGPCSTVSFFRTYDENDSTYAFDSSLYTLDTISGKPKIALKIGQTWPSTTIRPVNGIHIKGTFGFGTASSAVPQAIKEAVKITVANLYEHRGEMKPDEGLPSTAQMLLGPFRRWKV